MFRAAVLRIDQVPGPRVSPIGADRRPLPTAPEESAAQRGAPQTTIDSQAHVVSDVTARGGLARRLRKQAGSATPSAAVHPRVVGSALAPGSAPASLSVLIFARDLVRWPVHVIGHRTSRDLRLDLVTSERGAVKPRHDGVGVFLGDLDKEVAFAEVDRSDHAWPAVPFHRRWRHHVARADPHLGAQVQVKSREGVAWRQGVRRPRRASSGGSRATTEGDLRRSSAATVVATAARFRGTHRAGARLRRRARARVGTAAPRLFGGGWGRSARCLGCAAEAAGARRG